MKIILNIIFVFFVNIIFSQTPPYLFKDSAGNQFVVLSIEQAKILDNSTEYSPILWEDFDCRSVVDSVVNKVVEDKQVQINENNKVISILDEENQLLRQIINVDKQRLSALEEKSDIKDKYYRIEIDRKNEEIKQQKLSKRIISAISLFTITGLLIVIFGG